MTVPIRPPASAAASSRSSSAVASASGRPPPRCRVVGEEDPGQGDVLVLAQVRQVVAGGQAGAARPGSSASGDVTGRGEHPGAGRRRSAARSARSRRRRPARPRRAGATAACGSPSAARSCAIATRHRYGFCGRPAASPSSSARRRWSAAPARSPRSQATRLSPTCMSAVPRSGAASPCRPARGRRSKVRWASPSLPWVISMSARVMAQPRRRRRGRPGARCSAAAR